MANALRKNLILAFRDQNNSFKISFWSSRYDLYSKIHKLKLTKFENTLRRSQIYKMSAVITLDYFIIIHTSRTKGYVHKSVRPWSLNSSIVPVFWSLFEVSLQNISPFSNRIKPKIFETLSDATESNAQRNKLSLQATTSSGISHFRKTHLKRREVVMPADWCLKFIRPGTSNLFYFLNQS